MRLGLVRCFHAGYAPTRNEGESQTHRMDEDPNWNPDVFLKPRTGAFGEDCQIVKLRDFLTYS